MNRHHTDSRHGAGHHVSGNHGSGHHGPGQHGPGDAEHEAALANLLDLDALVLHDYLAEVTAWVRQHAAASPGTILDLGAGTGTGTAALAQCFESATVIAVDKSAGMLDRVRARAAGLGLADRVQTIQADLEAGWPDVPRADLAWMVNAMHELADPGQVLAKLLRTISPGGLLAVAELNAPPRFLPGDAGADGPAREARWHAALEQAHANPDHRLGQGVPAYLEEAGFVLLDSATFSIDLTPPHATPVGRYAQACLRQIRHPLADHLTAGDLAALDTLIDGDDPGGILHRDDLTVRASRTAWIARRP
jgi:SAM-dependent methyltransferase